MPRTMGTSRSDYATATITTVEEARDLAEEWSGLADACHGGPFSRPLYALAWWTELGQGSLLVVTVRHEGRLVALAPLHERRVGPLRVARWLGHGLGSVTEALVLPGHDEAGDVLWQVAAERRRVLDLLECHEDGPLPRAGLPGLRDVTSEPRDACPVIDLIGDAEAHLALPARKRVRRTVRVARRRLEEAGLDFGVRLADDTDSLEAVLPDVRRVFDVAEAAHPKQHLLAGEWESFTTTVLREGVASGEVLVLVGYVGPDPVVFDIVFVLPTATAGWIGRFDPVASRFSPGHLLQCAGLDWAHEHGKARVDLLLGDSYYKRLWADRAYRTLHVEAGPRTARRVLATVARLRGHGEQPAADDGDDSSADGS